MEKKEVDGLPPDGLKSGKGNFLKETKLIKRPFSAIKVIPHIQESEEILSAENPTLEELTKNRIAIHKLQVEKSAIKNEIAEKLIEEKKMDMSKYREKVIQKGKSYLEYRKGKMSQIKKKMNPGSEVGVSPVVVEFWPCRIRRILIEECLQRVCVNINETIPIWGNVDWEAGEIIDVTDGELPKFSLTDCVSAENEYTFSEGWLMVSGSVEITYPTVIKGIGVNFSARSCYTDEDGEDHIYGDEWGCTKIWSRFKVRSIVPGGAMSYIYNQKIEELNRKNSSGPTSSRPWLPNRRHRNMNYSVDEGHIFTIDYTLYYEVSRSADYNSAACLVFNDLVIRPYIIYQSCYNEWKRVRDDITSLAQLAQTSLVIEEEMEEMESEFWQP